MKYSLFLRGSDIICYHDACDDMIRKVKIFVTHFLAFSVEKLKTSVKSWSKEKAGPPYFKVKCSRSPS